MADETWRLVAALVDPVRRALYDHVRQERRPVTREDAARAVDISRALAAFHLDKLVELGMLRARYEAPADEPRGRGRSPKVYEVSGEGLTLTVPPRQYELIARILAHAVAEDPNDSMAAARRHAAALGRAMAAGVEGDDGGLSHTVRALTELGYEPRPDAADIVLANCPFHPLAAAHPTLICGINLDFVTGLLAGLGCHQVRAELRPDPPHCCVRLSQQ